MTCSKCMPDTLDEVLDANMEKFNKGGVMHLESLLSEIEYYNYETVSQIKGAISNRIEILKGDGNE